MTQLLAAFAWLAAPAHYTGPDAIPARLAEHATYTLLTLAIAALIALPLGLAIGHTGRGRTLGVQIPAVLRALPTLGLVILLALLVGIGLLAPLIALVVLALPPIVSGAYAGVESVETEAVDAARAVGMTEWQILWKVEVPLSLPLLLGGLRAATLQAIATWTVAAILPLGGLGRYIFDGLAVQDYPQMLAGSILVVALALAADGLFALLQTLLATGVGAPGTHPPAPLPPPRRTARGDTTPTSNER